MTDFYKETKSVVNPKQWKKYDSPFWEGRKPTGMSHQEGVIIGPLGISLIKIMNEDKMIVGALTKAARSILLLQVNVDVKEEKMTFKRGEFKDFNFKFSWGGGSGNPHKNKFGFKASVA